MTLQLERHKPMVKSILAAAAIWCAAVSADALKLQPFTAESMTSIESRYADRPFVLGLWSLTCPPCLHELETLGAWHARNPSVPIVLVATDDQDQAEAVSRALQEAGLSSADNWLFADPFIEKLRFKIDPNWRGELPRSYLYMAPGNRHAISGTLTTETLDKWQAHIQTLGATTPTESKQ